MGIGGHTGPHIGHSWLCGSAHMAELLCVCFLIFKMRRMVILRLGGLKKLNVRAFCKLSSDLQM